MFYCNACAKDNSYSESMIKSYGKCEICGVYGICNDRPSRSLPTRNKEINTKEIDVDTAKVIDRTINPHHGACLSCVHLKYGTNGRCSKCWAYTLDDKHTILNEDGEDCWAKYGINNDLSWQEVAGKAIAKMEIDLYKDKIELSKSTQFFLIIIIVIVLLLIITEILKAI